ncbi:hypothetical protein V2W45_1471479 [Cenococcum geophilum]
MRMILVNNPLIRKEGNYKKESTGGELSLILRKRKLNQLKRDGVINYNSNNSAKDSSGGSKGGKGSNSPHLPSSPPIPQVESTLLYSIKPPHNKASSYIHNEDKDSNSDGPTIKRHTRAKKDKINKINLGDKWEIDDILGERITKLGREYKVYKGGLLNSKDALKSYQRRVRHAKVGLLQVHFMKVKGRAAVRKGWR